ncbi:hypothetical protein [Pedobacter faecalis]|uniref:hypothetical protein n=1 Tax=Pedobacter faecalis TaxID=3041495 RepID=UPI00254C976E|nr:hypothetical protein [Pedobacter sp. ELA7]
MKNKKLVRTSCCLAYLMTISLSLFSQHVKTLVVGVEKLIENVELYPESASVHAAYQKAFRDIDSTIVITQYEKWRRKFPMSVGIHLAVLPFIKNTGYTFLPLKVSNSWDKGNLQNNGSAPVNFLIDQFGNILWKNFQAHNRDQQEAVELMIEESLNN